VLPSPYHDSDDPVLTFIAHNPATFSHGAKLPDPGKLFNAGLEGSQWRAIDFFEGDRINERALKNLVRVAVDYNRSRVKKKAPAGTRAKARKSKKT
jgi:hypothetical protein